MSRKSHNRTFILLTSFPCKKLSASPAPRSRLRRLRLPCGVRPALINQLLHQLRGLYSRPTQCNVSEASAGIVTISIHSLHRVVSARRPPGLRTHQPVGTAAFGVYPQFHMARCFIMITSRHCSLGDRRFWKGREKMFSHNLHRGTDRRMVIVYTLTQLSLINNLYRII